MSDPIVLLTKIDELHPHPNADKLELACVNGLQYVVGKGEFEVGDECLVIGNNSIVPPAIQEYLHLKDPRIKTCKLRGEVSNGCLIPFEVANAWMTGQGPDEGGVLVYATALGITKYEPPVRYEGPSAVSLPTTFQKYTDIQNIANWPNIFEPGERVWVSEKIDGQNFRIGVFLEDGKIFFKAGSHRQDRVVGQPHWKAFPCVAPLLTNYVANAVDRGASRYSLILYGELYGSMHGGYKAMNYGSPYEVRYTFYDICENGIYWDKDVMLEVLDGEGIPTPTGEWLEFDPVAIMSRATRISEVSTSSGDTREGVVITPKCERSDPRLGRVILKAINPEYLIRKGNHDVKDS